MSETPAPCRHFPDELLRLLPSLAVRLRLAELVNADAAGASGLTLNQLVTLLLVGTTEGARMRAGELARRLGISSPAATALVDRLVDAGVVERSRGEDRRVVWVSPTGAGSNLIERLQSGFADRATETLAAMDPAAQEALLDAMRRVSAFAERLSSASAGLVSPSQGSTSRSDGNLEGA